MMKETIYQFLQTIPAGKVISYKTLADYFGTSPRAIGKIMNSNRDPESFPCYKVVKNNGELWWFNKWVSEKIKRLEADHVLIIDNRIPADYFRHPDNQRLKKTRKWLCT